MHCSSDADHQKSIALSVACQALLRSRDMYSLLMQKCFEPPKNKRK